MPHMFDLIDAAIYMAPLAITAVVFGRFALRALRSAVAA